MEFRQQHGRTKYTTNNGQRSYIQNQPPRITTPSWNRIKSRPRDRGDGYNNAQRFVQISYSRPPPHWYNKHDRHSTRTRIQSNTRMRFRTNPYSTHYHTDLVFTPHFNRKEIQLRSSAERRLPSHELADVQRLHPEHTDYAEDMDESWNIVRHRRRRSFPYPRERTKRSSSWLVDNPNRFILLDSEQDDLNLPPHNRFNRRLEDISKSDIQNTHHPEAALGKEPSDRGTNSVENSGSESISPMSLPAPNLAGSADGDKAPWGGPPTWSSGNLMKTANLDRQLARLAVHSKQYA
ncbi:unnamed protein product [Cuscuta europaea]|uniref:Uncharacterized protein n=1 Tax=Cuscuta europaea TaxID=41803 RepID=A0A9P0ZPP9_CUSEU|nr:unnamed protein product [Cuscuta europaea]